MLQELGCLEFKAKIEGFMQPRRCVRVRPGSTCQACWQAASRAAAVRLHVAVLPIGLRTLPARYMYGPQNCTRFLPASFVSCRVEVRLPAPGQLLFGHALPTLCREGGDLEQSFHGALGAVLVWCMPYQLCIRSVVAVGSMYSQVFCLAAAKLQF